MDTYHHQVGYIRDIINSAGNVMIGGNLSVTGSIGNTSEGIGNHQVE